MSDEEQLQQSDGNNVPDDVIKDYADQAIASGRELRLAQDEQKSAAARHRNVYKAAKKAGVNIDVLKMVIGLREVDSSIREMNDRDRLRYGKLLGVPFGATQGELFEGEKPTAGRPASDDDETKANMAYDDGYKIGRTGANRAAANSFVPGSALFQEWDRGWFDGQKSAVEAQMPAKRGRSKAAAVPALTPPAEGEQPNA